MPKIKIKRGTNLSTSTDKLLSGELAIDTSSKRLYAGDTDNNGGKEIKDCNDVVVKGADYASKIGTKDSQSPIGSAIKPIYVASDGTVTQSNASVGTDETTADPTDSTKGLKPIVMASGNFVAATESHGTDDQPVYVDSGKIIPGQKYGGGTKVTLNGTDKGQNTATIYAPSSAPSSGSPDHKIAVYDIEQSGAVWSNDNIGHEDKEGFTPIYMSNGRFLAASRTFGSQTQPVYMYSGAIEECNVYAGGTKVTLNGTQKGGMSASFYAPESAGSTDNQIALWSTSDGKPKWKASSIGASTQPVYISSNGKVYPGSLYAGGTNVTLNGSSKGASTATIYAPETAGSGSKVCAWNSSGNKPSWRSGVEVSWEDKGSSLSFSERGIYAIYAKHGSKYYHTFIVVFPSSIDNGNNCVSSVWIEDISTGLGGKRAWFEGTISDGVLSLEARGSYDVSVTGIIQLAKF